MNFDLSEEQKLLSEQLRSLLAERSPSGRLRVLIDEGADWDEPLWRELAAMGFLGAAIPDAHGGAGLSAIDLGVISQELGRANVALPFFSSIVLAAGAIGLFGSETQKAAWLPALASGECVATFAYAERGSDWWEMRPACRLAQGLLDGAKAPVADGGAARLAVILVDDGGAPALALANLDQPGVERAKLPSFDHLRGHYSLSFAGVRAERLPGATDAEAVARLIDQAAVQAAFEAVGGAEACLTMARDYAMERRIFGRSLASYQAIKHRLADIRLAIELAKSNAYFAAWAVENAPGELPAAAAAARLTASAAFEMAVRENVQVHGGIGYTFEADCHFYYRRERTLLLSLGARERWADRLIAHAFDARAA